MATVFDPVASADPTADEAAELTRLYEDFAAAGMAPLWTQRAGLQPQSPKPSAVPAKWAWSTLFELAERAGRTSSGRSRWRATRNRPGQPRPFRRSVLDSDPMGSHSVPRTT